MNSQRILATKDAAIPEIKPEPKYITLCSFVFIRMFFASLSPDTITESEITESETWVVFSFCMMIFLCFTMDYTHYSSPIVTLQTLLPSVAITLFFTKILVI